MLLLSVGKKKKTKKRKVRGSGAVYGQGDAMIMPYSPATRLPKHDIDLPPKEREYMLRAQQYIDSVHSNRNYKYI